MIARLALLYLLVFAAVLALISVGAYMFLGMEYASLLAPAAGTPEAAIGYRNAMNHVAETIALFDVPLLIVVGAASYALARISLAPLLAGRERERQFVTDAAHELRSPLATIATIAQNARNASGEQSREALAHIGAVSIEASNLVGDLLTLAREPRAQLLHIEPLDLAALAKHVARDFEERAHERRIDLQVEASSAIVDGDERRLGQLIRNLLENALRHARSSVALRVDSADGRVRLVVQDDGPGIAPELRQRIFERSFTTGDGSGIGLAIAAWVVQAHAATIRVEDTPPTGSRFECAFPLMS